MGREAGEQGDPAGFAVGYQGAGLGHLHGIPIPDTVLASRTVTWTPDVTTTPRELELEIDYLTGNPY